MNVARLLTLFLLGILLAGHGNLAQARECIDNQDGIYTCSHIELLGSLTRAQMGADDSTVEDSVNDMWGWTDPDNGKEYAIVGMYHGTAFIDVSDPENPRFLGRLPSPSENPPAAESVLKACHDGCGEEPAPVEESASRWSDIKVYEHYAYIVSEQDYHGMLVFDLHDLRGVVTPQTFTAIKHVTTFRNAHNIFINEESGFAYVIGNTESLDATKRFGGLLIFDLSDPANPAQVAIYDEQQYIHDVMCTSYHGPDSVYQGDEICFASNSGTEKNTDPSSPYYGQSYYYDDNTDTYRSDWTYDGTYLNWEGGGQTLWPTPGLRYSWLTVLNVSDKSNIQLLSRAAHPGAVYVHQSWPSENHQYLFVDDELEESSGYGQRTRTYTYDISDLDDIRVLATYQAPSLSIDHNQYVKGRLLYQSNYTAGLRILDAIDPENLVEVAHFDSQPTMDDWIFLGSWSNYPYFDSGIVVISDIDDGLFVVKPSLEAADPLGSALAVNAALQDGGVDDHRYYFAIANNGPADANEIDVTMHLPWYEEFTGNIESSGASCSALERSITCQIEVLASCETAVFGLTLSNAAIDETEIIGMASARQLDMPDDEGKNLVSLHVSDKLPLVDTEELQSDLIAPACSSIPKVDAGDAQTVTSGDTVVLTATGEDEFATIVGYKWEQQLGPDANPAILAEPTLTFVAPSVSSVETLQFIVTVTNAYGKTHSDTVTVSVNPLPTVPVVSQAGSGGGAAFWLLPLLLGWKRFSRR